MTLEEFQNELRAGIPNPLPAPQPYDPTVNHAPKRKDILTPAEKKLAIRNALRYFDPKDHAMLAPEFAEELKKYGRIYMYRLRPTYKMYARPIDEYPAKCRQAAAIMLMIQNNLDPAVAQHPHELITYGGNGAVFQNWAQYRLVMKYLSEMTDEQTLVMYSGHPMGLYPSHKDAPRVVVTNGMMIPNYSKPDDWERYNALGVTQYGQMTAGSYMYIGPQGIVHGTTITVLNAARKLGGGTAGKLFITAGLGGMSGAQPKAGDIAGVVSITAEINPAATQKRFEQGWVDEVHADLDELFVEVNKAIAAKKARSFAYQGNVVDLWEYCAEKGIKVDLGSDQTSLHNPWAGGYYPVGISFEDAKVMMAEQPELFKEKVQESLRRHVAAVNKLTAKGMYFFDYGNAFLLESSRAGADITCRILWAPCASTMVSVPSVGCAPVGSPRTSTRATILRWKCWARLPLQPLPRFSSRCTTISNGLRVPKRTILLLAAKPVSSMPTAKAAPRLPPVLTRLSRRARFQPPLFWVATTTT